MLSFASAAAVSLVSTAGLAGTSLASRAFSFGGAMSVVGADQATLQVSGDVRLQRPTVPRAVASRDVPSCGAAAVAAASLIALSRSSVASTARRRTKRTRHCVNDSGDVEHACVEEQRDSAPNDKTIETMRKFSNRYAKTSGTYFCSDLSVASVVVIGLAHHKETLGAPLCPCRHYEDKEKEVKQGYWNCPCVPMRERHECHCMLFLEDSNPFSSDVQHLDLEEILKMKDQA